VSPRPDPGPAAPEPPEHLGVLGKQIWRQHAEELHRLRMLTPLDESVFEMFCASYENWRLYEDLSEKVGPQDAVRLGYRACADKAMQRAKSLAERFGLEPKSRTSIKTIPVGPVQTSLPIDGLDKDKKAELIRGTFHVAGARR
jgi:P27 family predicted phage terminase small subunit